MTRLIKSGDNSGTYYSPTITSLFFVPTLKIDGKDLKENNFINAFIKDIKREAQEDSVFLLFKPDNLQIFDYFVECEYGRINSPLQEDYDYSGGYSVLIYSLDPNYQEDFQLIKQGKYSHTSEDFQNLFPMVKKITNQQGLHRDELSLQTRIFKKTEDLKQYWEDKLGMEFKEYMEVWSGFDEEKETLNIDDYL